VPVRPDARDEPGVLEMRHLELNLAQHVLAGPPLLPTDALRRPCPRQLCRRRSSLSLGAPWEEAEDGCTPT
jgi:hypothetical protein